jgi:hypothetical protein
MFANPAANWYHSNRYNSQTVCPHCGGVVRHERWCITRDALVQYAFAVVSDATKLNLRDQLTLHALGVAWQENAQDELCAETSKR